MKTMIVRCELCSTEVRPNKAYCDPCKSRQIDALLDMRLSSMSRDLQWTDSIDRQLARIQANVRGKTLAGAR